MSTGICLEATRSGPKLLDAIMECNLVQVHFYGGWKYDMWRDPLYNGDYSNKVAQGFDHTRNSKYNDVATRGDDPGFCRKPVLLGEVQVRGPSLLRKPVRERGRNGGCRPAIVSLIQLYLFIS